MNKEACPHLGFQACAEVLAENQRLKAQNADLRRIFDIATEAFKEKEAEIQRLKRENEVLRRKLKDICQRPFAQSAGGEDAEETDNESAQQQQEPVRKKRGAPMGHRGATRKKPQRKPDRTVFVRPEQCPDCDSHDISPCQDTQEHIQEDIVIIRPILTRFIKQRGYCRKCGRLFFPKGPGERPKGYIGPVGVAVAGYLRYALKMPFESVAKIFKGFWGMDITPSALVGIDKNLTNKARPLYELIEDMTRYSNTINADETGWPVGAVNQWLSAYANVDFVLLKINPSRSGAVPQSVLGNNYGGVLGSDCFSAYNTVKAQAKQKCLTHYERGAKNLEKFYPEDQQALLFASCLKDIFKRARQIKRDWLDGKIADAQASQKAEDFEEELDQLVEPCVENQDAEKLRKRLIAHRNENFTFLRYKKVDADNNRAERALRPSVVMRKITYGNNSETGARNHETLMSLVETAKLHKTNPLDVMMGLAGGMDFTALKKMLFGVSEDEKVTDCSSPQPHPWIPP